MNARREAALLAEKASVRSPPRFPSSCFRAPPIFQQPFPSNAAIPGGGNVSLLSLAGSSGIFLCRQIGLLRSQLVPQKRVLSRAPRIFSPIPYLGDPSRYFPPHPLQLSSPPSLPVFLTYHPLLRHLLSRSRISKCCAVVKTTNSDGKPLVTGASAAAAGDFSNSDRRHLARVRKRRRSRKTRARIPGKYYFSKLSAANRNHRPKFRETRRAPDRNDISRRRRLSLTGS